MKKKEEEEEKEDEDEEDEEEEKEGVEEIITVLSAAFDDVCFVANGSGVEKHLIDVFNIIFRRRKIRGVQNPFH